MKELTSPPLEMFPPNKSSTESETPVESRRNTEFTFTFSLKTNHGYGILGTPAFTEFYLIQFRINNKAIIILQHWCFHSNRNAYKNVLKFQKTRNLLSTEVLDHPPLFSVLLTSLCSVETKFFQCILYTKEQIQVTQKDILNSDVTSG